jgi:aspartokinase
MGFESSNLSALLIAKALECDSIDIYTKVNQIHILDPELYDTHQVNYIPYRSAKRLALSGNKLFFPGMIELAESRKIVIKYKGLESTKETIISEKDAFDYPVIYKRDNEYIITPIKSENAISIIQKYSSEIGDFSYTIQDFTLALIRCELKEIEIQESVISLLKKH